MKALKKIAITLGILLLIGIGGVSYYLVVKIGPIGAGYKAKMLCSYLFVSGRELGPIMADDLEPFNPLLEYVSHEIDSVEKSVVASAFGLVNRKARYQEGLGCTILPPGAEDKPLFPDVSGIAQLPENPESVPWPTGDLDAEVSFPGEIDSDLLSEALDREFSEPDAEKPRRTRAVVVVYKGRIVAERYAPGFDRDTRMHGWSMTKSITSALIGILVGQGSLEVNQPAAGQRKFYQISALRYQF